MEEANSDVVASAEVAKMAVVALKRSKSRKPRSCWVRPWTSCRPQLGYHEARYIELSCHSVGRLRFLIVATVCEDCCLPRTLLVSKKIDQQLDLIVDLIDGFPLLSHFLFWLALC
jgi:hypothetical protein